MKTFYTYILLCDQKTFYVGCTVNLSKRLNEHRNKLSFHTSKFSDIRLVYMEKNLTLVDARRREKQFKGWSHAKKENYIREHTDLEGSELDEELAGMRSSP